MGDLVRMSDYRKPARRSSFAASEIEAIRLRNAARKTARRLAKQYGLLDQPMMAGFLAGLGPIEGVPA